MRTEQPKEGGKEESGTGRECKVKGQTKGKRMGGAPGPKREDRVSVLRVKERAGKGT